MTGRLIIISPRYVLKDAYVECIGNMGTFNKYPLIWDSDFNVFVGNYGKPINGMGVQLDKPNTHKITIKRRTSRSLYNLNYCLMQLNITNDEYVKEILNYCK